MFADIEPFGENSYPQHNICNKHMQCKADPNNLVQIEGELYSYTKRKLFVIKP